MLSWTNIYNTYTDMYIFIVYAVELQTPHVSDDELL
jgi:hypothetical protein